MPKKGLNSLPKSGFIPGIYNFCDRWCKKCNGRTKCLCYVMEKKFKLNGGSELLENWRSLKGDAWEYWEHICNSTYHALREVADERKVNIEDICSSELYKGRFWNEFDDDDPLEEEEYLWLETLDAVKICQLYEILAEECLDKIFGLLDEQDLLPESKSQGSVSEALEVVNWYLDMMQPKIRQAFYDNSERSKFFFRNIEKGEWNGIAKVVLVAIERSLEAWEEMEKYCSSLKPDFIHLKVVLEQLEREIEISFPHARNFLRPGLDI